MEDVCSKVLIIKSKFRTEKKGKLCRDILEKNSKNSLELELESPGHILLTTRGSPFILKLFL